MEDCSCAHCYHGICFHPVRSDGAGLGVPCDGCTFEGEHRVPELLEEPSDIEDNAPIITMMLLAQFKE
ncbi:TPA: hypothetical protein HA251_05715 [Candidatus Woesearchaeota archaeon]|nr:hypothetical protein [Candidatus Woesearchaeota archaeon]